MRAATAVIATLLSAGCFSGYEKSDRGDLEVRRGTLVSEMVLTGELEAARGAAITVPMLPNWQTSIKWMAPEGVEVKEGERVVELDNSTFTADLDTKRQTELQARQELQQKTQEWKADLEQKQLDFEKKKSDFDKAKIEAAVPAEILSTREYEDRQTKLHRARVEFEKAEDLLRAQRAGVQSDRKNLELRLQKAQREIRIAETAIDALILRAPRDGIVVIRDHPWEGRKLQTGDTVFIGFHLALIPELNSLQVSAALADVDDGRIAVGMPATITLDGYPDLAFAGKVAAISAVAQESARQSLRRAFRVVLSLDRVDAQRMRPSLSARVNIRRGTTANALIAPRAALEVSGNEAKAHLANGNIVPVRLGSCNAQECVVTAGLAEGQRLARWGANANG